MFLKTHWLREEWSRWAPYIISADVVNTYLIFKEPMWAEWNSSLMSFFFLNLSIRLPLQMNLTWRFSFNKLWQNLIFVFQIVFCEWQVERFCVLKQTKVSLGRVRDLEWSHFREMDLISLGSSFLKIEKILTVSAIYRNGDDLKGLTELCKQSTLSQEKNYSGNFAHSRNCLRQFIPVFLVVIFL